LKTLAEANVVELLEMLTIDRQSHAEPFEEVAYAQQPRFSRNGMPGEAAGKLDSTAGDASDG
jgi:hypothetical protein